MKPIDQKQLLLTVEEVAGALRLSRRTVYQMVRDGELVAVKFGRRTLFRQATIDALIVAHEQPARPGRKRARS
jgi:excisionase family DNA binding protein